MWIDQGLGIPPIEFRKLLNRLLPQGELRAEIDALIQKKKAGDELDLAQPIPIISDFIISQMGRFTEATKETSFTKSWTPLDKLFRRVLVQENGNKIHPSELTHPTANSLDRATQDRPILNNCRRSLRK